MGNKKPSYPEAQILAALRATNGRQYLAARDIGCNQKTIERAIKRYPAVAALVKSYRGQDTDQIENVLRDRAKAGEPWAVCFFLKTQAKDRGYVERHEFVEIKELTDDELIRFIEERTGTGSGGAEDCGTPEAPAATLH